MEGLEREESFTPIRQEPPKDEMNQLWNPSIFWNAFKYRQ